MKKKTRNLKRNQNLPVVVKEKIVVNLKYPSKK
jgi:hypothetical protein